MKFLVLCPPKRYSRSVSGESSLSIYPTKMRVNILKWIISVNHNFKQIFKIFTECESSERISVSSDISSSSRIRAPSSTSLHSSCSELIFNIYKSVICLSQKLSVVRQGVWTLRPKEQIFMICKLYTFLNINRKLFSTGGSSGTNSVSGGSSSTINSHTNKSINKTLSLEVSKFSVQIFLLF